MDIIEICKHTPLTTIIDEDVDVACTQVVCDGSSGGKYEQQVK